ncbi:MAG TPA: YidC/Oxa1 family membrane protein insertase, partial [Candidatus Aphodoplasma excrementigallinarum]|nr:YidC/Oxa1 family membrane protein insertase [Candidatus Aphodoplasma excrementigallinarum]
VQPMGFIIEFIYNFIPNYGVALILFTILIKLLILPLNLKSQRSMVKQQKLMPQIQELQKKYANDKEKLNKEMMELYQANGANPASGCLPLLLQFPIIIGLFQVIQKPLSYMLRVNFNAPENINKVIELQQIVANNPDLSAMAPGGFLDSTMEGLANNFQIAMSNFAANPAVQGFTDWVINFNFLGLDLSRYPSEVWGPLNSLLTGQVSPQLWTTLPLLLIPVLSGLTSWLLSKMSTSNSPQASAAADGTNTAASMNKSMMLMMPIMSILFTFSLPCGVGLYWIVSNVTQMIQQYFTVAYFKKKEENTVVIDTVKKNRKDRKKHR